MSALVYVELVIIDIEIILTDKNATPVTSIAHTPISCLLALLTVHHTVIIRVPVLVNCRCSIRQCQM